MYFIIKAALRTLLLPPASPLILAMLGVLLLRRRRQLGATLLAVGLIAQWMFATPVVADSLLRLTERYPALDLSKPVQAQAIVIIGGGSQRKFAPEYGGPSADDTLLERLSYGAFISRRTGLPILLSGAPTESRTMGVSLTRDFGVRPQWLENKSRDTYENARFSARILRAVGIKRIILVTSATHLWRATHEFEQAGFEVTPAPSGVWAPRETSLLRFAPSAAALMRSSAAIYELIGEPMRRLQSAAGVRELFY
jgi:uncharacterized SAM-binding protein YcdF (DUF218 family)